MNLAPTEGTVVPSAIVLAAAVFARLLRETRVGQRTPLGSPWLPAAIALPLFLGHSVFHGRSEPWPLVFAVLLGLAGNRGALPLAPHPISRGRRIGLPLLLGSISAMLAAWVWSGGGFTPVVHDETAYLLQAGVFAEGRWSDPAPPHPEFFEQAHVLVLPRRAAKYPPGHSLAMSPGIALGFAPAVPLLFTAASAALLFGLTRRLAGEVAGLAAWLVWTTAPGGLRDRTSYFSEVTTAFLWLGVWWAVWRWRETGRRGWLVAAALGVGWGASTRPLTMLLFALPLSILVAVAARRRRAFRDVALACVAGLLPLLLFPIWASRTTGKPGHWPLAAYTRAYLPFDRPGFGSSASPPQRMLPECLDPLDRFFRRVHSDHTMDRLPGTLRDRLGSGLRDLFGAGRGALLPLALLGLLLLPKEGILAAATALLLYVGYLVYAHPAAWTIYYLETHAVWSAAVGIGASRALALLPHTVARIAGTAAFATVLFAGILQAAVVREGERTAAARTLRFRAALSALPREKAVVFVGASPKEGPHDSLVTNGPGLRDAPLWVAHDYGDENDRLLRAAGGRKAYLYEEPPGRLIPHAQRRETPRRARPL